jgi:hypothetical protein
MYTGDACFTRGTEGEEPTVFHGHDEIKKIIVSLNLSKCRTEIAHVC